jgi:hypothetical protein
MKEKIHSKKNSKYKLKTDKIKTMLFSLNAFSLLANIYYIFNPAKGYINSDTAAYSNVARIIVKEKTLFPSNYFFANDDLLTFSPSLIIALFALFFGYGYLAQALSIICLLIFLQFTLFKFAKFYGASQNTALMVSGTFIAFQSIGLNQLILGNGIGTLLTILGTLWLLMLWIDLFSIENKKTRKSKFATISLILSFIFMSSPGRTVISFIFPLIMASVFTLFQTNQIQVKELNSLKGVVKTLSKFRHFFYLFVILSLIFVFRYINMEKVLMQNAAFNRGFVQNESVSTNLNNFINGIAWITGIKPELGVLLISIKAMSSFLIFVMFYLVAINSRIALKELSFKEIFTRYFIFVAILSSAYVYFFTSLNVDYLTVRYLYIPLLFWFIYVIIKGLSQERANRKLLLAIVLCLSAISVGALNTQINTGPERMKNDRIVNFLTQNSDGVFAGTYWNAQKYEFLSEGKIRALPVLLDPTVCIESFDWMVSRENVQSRTQSVVLLLDIPEESELMSSDCSTKLKLIAEIEDKRIYSYQGNW